MLDKLTFFTQTKQDVVEIRYEGVEIGRLRCTKNGRWRGEFKFQSKTYRVKPEPTKQAAQMVIIETLNRIVNPGSGSLLVAATMIERKPS